MVWGLFVSLAEIWQLNIILPIGRDSMLSWIIFVSIITAILWWLGGILNIDQHKTIIQERIKFEDE